MGDFELRMAGIQRSFEKDGVPWNGGASIGFVMTTVETLRAELAAERKRIAQLEKQAEALKKSTDHHARHGMTFAGTFDLEHNYNEGALVLFKGIAFVAGRDIAAGKADPPRQGSGWIRIV